MMFFGRLREAAEKARLLQMKQQLKLLFLDIGIQDLVIELNTEGQLFDKGIDARNRRLKDIGGSYAPSTVFIKSQKGQPVNRITLKDTGDFYNSFDVIIDKDCIEIVADTIKGGIDLQIRWGSDILGLNDDSKKILIDKIIPVLIDEIKDNLLN